MRFSAVFAELAPGGDSEKECSRPEALLDWAHEPGSSKTLHSPSLRAEPGWRRLGPGDMCGVSGVPHGAGLPVCGSGRGGVLLAARPGARGPGPHQDRCFRPRLGGGEASLGGASANAGPAALDLVPPRSRRPPPCDFRFPVLRSETAEGGLLSQFQLFSTPAPPKP